MNKKVTKKEQVAVSVPEEKKEKTAESAVEQVPQAQKKASAIARVKIYINASYNNTVITVANEGGDVLAWATAGSLGFAGPKKATPFASSKVVAAITEKLKNRVPNEIEIVVKGIGGGRDSAVRSLINQGFNIVSIKDVTPIPHNGPRPRKVRRG